MTRLSVASVLLTLLVCSPALAQSLAVSPATADAAVATLRADGIARGLAPDALDLVAVSGHRRASGEARVYVQQRLDGIDIAEAITVVAVGRDGRVRSTAGQVVGRLDGPDVQKTAVLSREAAIEQAAALVGLRPGALTVGRTEAGPMQRAEVLAPGIAREPLKTRLVYVRTPELRLAWEVGIYTLDSAHYWLVRIDAETGAELQRFDLVVHDTFGPPRDARAPEAPSVAPLAEAVTRGGPLAMIPRPESARGATAYKVYPVPIESPIHTAPAPPMDGRTTVVDPADATASPFGWHDTDGIAGDEWTITRGNNAHAYSDAADDDTGDPGDSPDCGAGIDCTFSLDLSMEPATYAAAAITNLFYWNNVIHDVMHGYGFTPEAGNFQFDTYGAAGVGGDDVHAEAQDAETTDNANFFTPADGENPRMQMFLWDAFTPMIDGDFDNGIIVHEYGHGITNRLVGGPTAIACLTNAEQMGEGWSDWYALMFTMEAGDAPTDARGIGTYVLGEPPGGPGIRPAPYSTDFGVNPFTYGATAGGGLSVPHGIGFVWATALWDATWALIGAEGFSPDLYDEDGGAGNQIMLNIVTEALTLTECSPGFLAARNAVLEAAATLYPDPSVPDWSVYSGLLWEAFAGRGMGVSMDQKSPFSNADNLEAFDVPPPPFSASVAPTSFSETLAPGAMTSLPLTVTHTGVPTDGDLHITATVVDGTVPLTGDGPAPEAEIRTPQATGAPATPREATRTGATRTAPEASGGNALLAGGPDAYGYTFVDSDEAGGPAVDFIDISGTAPPLMDWTPTGAFAPTDEGYVDVPLPFPFPFYGRIETSVRVFTNGFVTFDTDYTLDSFINGPIPSAGPGAPEALIAPFWDDLLFSASSAVYAGDAPDGRFVIQYDAMDQPGPLASLTFQILLADDGDIEFQYGLMTGVKDGATVGIENHAGTDGLEVVESAPYIDSAMAIAFESPELWAAVAPGVETVAGGTVAPLTLFLNATDLAPGIYSTTIEMTTDDPALLTLSIPLTLTVTSATIGVIDGPAGWRLLAPPHAGLTVDDLAGMNLVAGVPGYYPTFSEDTAGADPTLMTDLDGSDWVPSTGTGEELELGHGFYWYLYDAAFTPAEATTSTSSSVELPFTLMPTAPFNTADVDVPLTTAGLRYNALGNPFGTSLDLSDIHSWPGGKRVASKGRARTWDPVAATWVDATTSPLPAWHGFVVRAKKAGGTVTIPASAAMLTDAPEAFASGDDDRPPTLRLVLDGAEAETGRPLADRDLALVLTPEATNAWDDHDDAKLAPLSGAYVALGFAGTREDAPVLKAVESRSPEAAAFSVPLALETAGAAEALTLRWPSLADLPRTWRVTLDDVVTGTTVDLRAADHYAFTAASGAAKAARRPTITEAAVGDVRFLLHVETDGAEAPAPTFALDPVRPNPVRGSATVAFSLAGAAEATLTVHDVRGREVATLARGHHEAGRHTATWATGALASGVYVVRLVAGDAVQTQRAVVVR